MSRSIRRSPGPRTSDQHAHSLGTSYKSQCAEQTVDSIAEESIARDLADEDLEQAIEDEDVDENVLSRTTTQELGPHSMAGSHRSSWSMNGPRPFFGMQQPEITLPVEHEQEAAINEERSLLRDNKLIPPKHARRRDSQTSVSSDKGLRHRVSMLGFGIPRRQSISRDEESVVEATEDTDTGAPSETTALLSDGHRSYRSIKHAHLNPRRRLDTIPGTPNVADGSEYFSSQEHANNPQMDSIAPAIPTNPEAPYGGEDTPANIDKKWESAVSAGQIETSWQREAKVLAGYSLPLTLTFILQQSLTLTSIFIVGHIGKIELGAVSLGGMTANITGYAVYIGLATSLDTLCAQAYGSGKKKLVGLQLQRMVFFLWTCTIPIACLWLAGTQILELIVPEKEIAQLAGRYLKVLILGAPGYALFESSKRYVQAQGRFAATTYALLITAPINVLLHWLFVWQFKWGFIGCPIAIVISNNLMPLLLFLYVRFVGGMECWPGFTRAALRNWGPMVRLALPGFVMVMAEFLAFEILTLAAARISADHLAANTVLQSLCILMYCLPFVLSIAGSTRIANLIGATLPEAAKVTARVNFTLGIAVGILNMVLLSSLRFVIPPLFTPDPEVIQLAAATLPINALFQLWDALAAQCNGVLRGLGKQSVGGIVSLAAFYGIALPISFGTGFGLHWELVGLWTGPAVGLFVQFIGEGIYIYWTSWQKASEEAAKRNAAG